MTLFHCKSGKFSALIDNQMTLVRPIPVQIALNGQNSTSINT